MEQPEGFNDGTGRVCKLKKSLYGLKQSPRCWGEEIARFFEKNGYTSSEGDSCLYVLRKDNELVIVLLYVDDGLILSTNQKLTDELLDNLKRTFKITVEKEVKSFLGIEIERGTQGIRLCNREYINKMIRTYRLEDATPVDSPMTVGWKNEDSKEFMNHTLYRELVGQLMYLNMVSRPDISFAVNVLARAFEKPSVAHWNLARRTVRYLKGSRDEGIMYKKNMNVSVTGYTDSDYAGDIVTRRSMTGVLVMMGGAPVVWKSRLQQVVALSTAEAELMAAVEGCKELIWSKKVLYDVFGDYMNKINVNIDNQSTIQILKNPAHHQKTKHVDVKLKYLRGVYENSGLVFKYCPTNEQLADGLTKGYNGPSMGRFRRSIGFELKD